MSQVHGEMRELDQTRSVTMILKGKDMDWWIDTACIAWRQQIPSLQGFELIVMGLSQRFHYRSERITVDLRGSVGHHGTMGYKAMKWTWLLGESTRIIGLTSSKSYDLWLSIKVPGALFDQWHMSMHNQSFLPWLLSPHNVQQWQMATQRHSYQGPWNTRTTIKLPTLWSLTWCAWRWTSVIQGQQNEPASDACGTLHNPSSKTKGMKS